nr:osmotin-like protein [Lolium perenne]
MASTRCSGGRPPMPDLGKQWQAWEAPERANHGEEWADHGSRWVGWRTFCRTPTSCDTGSSPPRTVVQLGVHSTEDLATYSVSLEDGFNLATVVTPLFSGGGQCLALGCPLNLTDGCPVDQVKIDDCRIMVACKGDPGYFKRWCPLTRVNNTDREPLPQSCIAPRELKVVFCQTKLAHLTMLRSRSFSSSRPRYFFSSSRSPPAASLVAPIFLKNLATSSLLSLPAPPCCCTTSAADSTSASSANRTIFAMNDWIM